MSRNTISQSVKYGLHFIGIWPGTPFPVLRKVFWLLSTVFCQIYQYKYMITHFKTEGFIEMIDSLSVALTYSLMIGKLFVAWINHGVICEILSTMEDDCAKYAALDRNNVMSKTADLISRLTTMIPAVHMLSTCCIAIGTLVIPQSNDSNDRQLLMDMDWPFDTNQSPTYELVLAAQIIFQGVAGYTYGMFCCFLLMSILHAGCVIDILCNIIPHLSSEKEGQFRFVAMRHQEIILFTQRIERLFTYIALCQLLTNTLIICCLGFLFITVINTGFVISMHKALQVENGLPLILKSFLFYVVMCSEIFMYCFAGEYLNTKSKMIVDAICETTWYDLQPTTSRRLVLLILKSQKGLPLTFGKFSSLSLQSFANIMKASASYMSVLLAMS
ncbi:odorant receptor 10-like isoform X7 [Halictus rubicundus]|uniref:odorant receptor 10-like isoform X7 n=1 Tax=Halictus rubicundus TaxID=77578 RepID=UPI004035F553